MSELHIDRHLYTARPEPEGRLPREMAVYDLLESLDIPFVRVDHEAARTIEAYRGREASLGQEICKKRRRWHSQKKKCNAWMVPGQNE